MGKHSKQTSRGKHRAPSSGGALARAVVGVAVVTLGVGASLVEPAHADTDAGFTHRDAIIECESGGDPRAENPSPKSSASGLYQMIDSTWRSVRGSSTAARAKDASVAEQHSAALRLFKREGYTPWNASRSCWSQSVSAASSDSSSSSSAPKVVRADVATSLRDAPTRSERLPRKQNASYTVRAGDTLSSIAQHEHGTDDWSTLYELNTDVVADPHVIHPGDVLNVRSDR